MEITEFVRDLEKILEAAGLPESMERVVAVQKIGELAIEYRYSRPAQDIPTDQVTI